MYSIIISFIKYMSELSENSDVKEIEALEDPPAKKSTKKEVKMAAKVVTKKKPPPPESESEEEEEEIQQPTPKAKRTPAQMAAFEKARATKAANAILRAKEAKKKEDDARAALEAKIVQKALSIKKRQIKRAAALEEISDDDTPVEKIKQIAKKIPPAVITAQPKVAFRFI
jgi:hypothetical protein